MTVSRPDSQTSKAVADGAIGFYCDHHVSARMSKFSYGVEFLREYDPRDPEHLSRRSRLCELPSGPKLLPDAFDCILGRVSVIHLSVMYWTDTCRFFFKKNCRALELRRVLCLVGNIVRS